MSVVLTPELEAQIRQRVASGRYASATDVVGEALRLLDERDQLEHLRSLLAVGLDQSRRGETVEFTPELEEELARRAEEQFRRGELPNIDVCP